MKKKLLVLSALAVSVLTMTACHPNEPVSSSGSSSVLTPSSTTSVVTPSSSVPAPSSASSVTPSSSETPAPSSSSDSTSSSSSETPVIVKHTVTVTAPEHGHITPSAVEAKEGDDVVFVIEPDAGYKLKEIKVNDADKTADVNSGSLTVKMGKENLTVTASFALIEVSAVTLNKDAIRLDLADKDAKDSKWGKFTLKATVDPKEVLNKKVVFTSSDPSVAAVDENGVVTPVKAGTAKITASSESNPEKKAECAVTVVDSASLYESQYYNAADFAKKMKELGLSGKAYTKREIGVFGTAKASSYNAKYQSYTVTLEAGDEDVQIYSGKIIEAYLPKGLDAEKAQEKNGLKGYFVLGMGYAKDYVSKDGKHNTYELSYMKIDDKECSPNIDVAIAPTAMTLSYSSSEVGVAGKVEPQVVTTPDGSIHGALNYEIVEGSEFADISNSGTLTGKKEGTVKVKATDSIFGLEATAEVKVVTTFVPVKEVNDETKGKVTFDKGSVKEGETLKVNVAPVNGNCLTSLKVDGVDKLSEIADLNKGGELDLTVGKSAPKVEAEFSEGQAVKTKEELDALDKTKEKLVVHIMADISDENTLVSGTEETEYHLHGHTLTHDSAKVDPDSRNVVDKSPLWVVGEGQSLAIYGEGGKVNLTCKDQNKIVENVIQAPGAKSLVLDDVTIKTLKFDADDPDASENDNPACVAAIINCSGVDSVTLNKTTITADAVYAIATNNTKGQGAPHLVIKDSTIKVKGGDRYKSLNGFVQGDCAAVIANADKSEGEKGEEKRAVIEIENSTIEGGRQGVIARAGKWIIKNSTISSTGEYITSNNGTDGRADKEWKSGNEVTSAALVVGDKNDKAYNDDADVTLTNVRLQATKGYALSLSQDPNGTYKTNFTADADSELTFFNSVIKEGSYTDYKSNFISVNEAEEKAKAGSKDKVYVIGYVSEIKDGYQANFGNISFTMSDDLDDSSASFEGFRVKTDEETSKKIIPGAKVLVAGNLTSYKGTYEIGAGGSLVIIEEAKPAVKATIDSASIDVGKTAQITVEEQKDVTFSYKSSDETVATVDDKGVVTGVKVGKAEITVLASTGRKAVVEVTVTNPGEVKKSVYKLDCSKPGKGNQYAADNNISQNGIDWIVQGNTNVSQKNPADYYGIGGKSIDKVDRHVYTTAALASDVNDIEIVIGNANGVTVNSMSVGVYSTADLAAKGGEGDVAYFTPTFVTNNTITVTKADEKSWANCFYNITFNVSVSDTSNKRVELKSIEFFDITK